MGVEMYIESVTSALVRASGPPACPLLCCIAVAASCEEESDSSQDLDSPSAKAKDDCFLRRLVPASWTLQWPSDPSGFQRPEEEG